MNPLDQPNSHLLNNVNNNNNAKAPAPNQYMSSFDLENINFPENNPDE